MSCSGGMLHAARRQTGQQRAVASRRVMTGVRSGTWVGGLLGEERTHPLHVEQHESAGAVRRDVKPARASRSSRVTPGPWPAESQSCLPFTFTFRALSRRFYPKRLTISTFVRKNKKRNNISLSLQ